MFVCVIKTQEFLCRCRSRRTVLTPVETVVVVIVVVLLLLTQSCPSVASTHGLGWVGLGWVEFFIYFWWIGLRRG